MGQKAKPHASFTLSYCKMIGYTALHPDGEYPLCQLDSRQDILPVSAQNYNGV